MKLSNEKLDGSASTLGAVVFASSYTALEIVRSLGRQGIPVWILDDGISPARFSRYVQRRFHLDLDHEDALVEMLIRLAQKNGLQGWALFPDGDKGTSLIARHYEVLGEYYKLTTPSWDMLQWAVDKRKTYLLADEAGLDYPKTFYPKNRSEVEAVDGRFPMIVKPLHHQGNDAFSNGRAWEAGNMGELISLYDKMCKLTDPSIIVIQEMISSGKGTQFSYGALCKDGEVLADIFAERKRLTPPEFGVSSFVESIERPELEMPSKRWLKKNNYTGIVELEFMYDKQDGLYKILDVNTRAWGWIAMCAHAGVDFPYLLWKMIRGEDVPVVRARSGVRWMRTAYDFESVIQSMWKGKLTLQEYISSLKGANHEMYARDDLVPAAGEVLILIRRAWNKLMKILRRSPL